MPKTRRDLIADAYQSVRDLRNELHQAKQVNLPLQGQVVGLGNECERLREKVKALTLQNEAYRQALTGMVELVHAVATGKS
jgi:hypothetical protein